ncbi:MAG: hypothetical protein M4579_007010 [Chaenotheca gracillima]|nr:MAG: hypothetical protein M4579_007010 [Chaenotheca gracillima]
MANLPILIDALTMTDLPILIDAWTKTENAARPFDPSQQFHRESRDWSQTGFMKTTKGRMRLSGGAEQAKATRPQQQTLTAFHVGASSGQPGSTSEASE